MNNKIPKLDVEIYLAKPNKRIIGKLNEAFNINQTLKLGQLNEISFSIPYTVERYSEFIENKHVKEIKQRYLLKVKYLDKEEWHLITGENESLNDKNVKEVTAYSLGYQLSDKYIRSWAGVEIDGEYRKESLNMSQVLTSVLSSTIWKIGYMDSVFITRYRAFDFSATTVLEAIFTIAEKYNAIIEWDTDKREIHFYDPETYGQFNGLTVSDDKYLKSYEKQVKSEEMATRLRVYGKDGISINEVNPIGVEYIDDFSYFMQGFSIDANRNVLSSSPYMSDSLCFALIDYNTFLSSNESTFNDLTIQRDNAYLTITEKENELSSLETELITIQDAIDLKQSQELDVSNEKSEESAKKIEIANKASELEFVYSSLDNIIAQITDYKNSILLDNHFTQDEINELNDFIIEKVWENQNVSDPKELIELAKKEFEKLNKPNVVYNIGIVNLLKIAEAKKDVKKLRLGNKIRIHKKNIDEITESQVIEMKIDYDGNDISLSIADTTNLNSDEDELIKLIYSSASIFNTVNMNKNVWDDISSVGNQVNELLNNRWDSAKQEIVAGVNETVTIDRRGITITDSTDPLKFIRMTNSVIGMTNDGGDTFKLGLTPEGVTAETIVGRMLIGQHLYMENEKGSFRFDQDGVTIQGTSLEITGGLPASQLDPSFKSGLVEMNKSYVNGIRIDTSEGLTVTRGDDKVKSTFNATDGIKIEVKKGTDWIKEFYYDVLNERLVVDGEINARELKVNGNSVLTSGGKIKASSIEAENLTVSAANISGKLSANQINTVGLTAERVETKYSTTLVSELYKDTNGGRLLIYDNVGALNATIGVESGTKGNVGGTIALYNDGLSNQRASFGILNTYDAGAINLSEGHNGSPRTRISIYANSNLGKPTIAILDENGSSKTRLHHDVGYINGQKILTEGDTVYAKFA